jgi:hypothetical protein
MMLFSYVFIGSAGVLTNWFSNIETQKCIVSAESGKLCIKYMFSEKTVGSKNTLAANAFQSFRVEEIPQGQALVVRWDKGNGELNAVEIGRGLKLEELYWIRSTILLALQAPTPLAT